MLGSNQERCVSKEYWCSQSTGTDMLLRIEYKKQSMKSTIDGHSSA